MWGSLSMVWCGVRGSSVERKSHLCVSCYPVVPCPKHLWRPGTRNRFCDFDCRLCISVFRVLVLVKLIFSSLFLLVHHARSSYRLPRHAPRERSDCSRFWLLDSQNHTPTIPWQKCSWTKTVRFVTVTAVMPIVHTYTILIKAKYVR